MKKILFVTCLLALAIFSWKFRLSILKYWSSPKSSFVQQLKDDISAPPPLIGSFFEHDTFLTVAGVLNWTNVSRKDNGNLPPLKLNSKLNAAAESKIKDMFAKQYFEHESPEGKGPADLAKAANYQYIAIAENLALGNFENDEDLVLGLEADSKSWMHSPGHRENILNPKYEEIGIAVAKGNYKGKKVWMAVQEFGRPLSSCPIVSSSMKTQIENIQEQVDSLEVQLSQMKQELDSISPKNKQEYDAYNQKVSEFNDLVRIYNNKIDRLKMVTQEYNEQVKAYNSCLSS